MKTGTDSQLSKTDIGEIVTSSETFTVQSIFPAGRSDVEQRTMRARETNTDHTSHGSYLNSSTSNSMIKGFATALAAIEQTMDRGNKVPLPDYKNNIDIR